MNDTLYHLCRICCDIMDGWHPVPARIIAELTGVSVSTARRRLRKLMDAQSNAMSDQFDFLEDCLVEMAMIVYAE